MPSQVCFVRPHRSGKFLYAGNEKFWVRGITYGTFRPSEDGCEYPRLEVVEQDFAQIVAAGLNTIRTYTVPPRWLLNAAQQYALRVLVGLPSEQHITYLDDRKRAAEEVAPRSRQVSFEIVRKFLESFPAGEEQISETTDVPG